MQVPWQSPARIWGPYGYANQMYCQFITSLSNLVTSANQLSLVEKLKTTAAATVSVDFRHLFGKQILLSKWQCYGKQVRSSRAVQQSEETLRRDILLRRVP